jgi:hypothetical protein
VYIEEPAEDLTITVNNEDYQAEATVDIDDDGIEDTAVVETDDGSIAFSDTNSDGQADLMTRLDAEGDIVGRARFDESSGEWVQVNPDEVGETKQTSGGITTGDITAAGTPEGEVEVNAPTHDTDGDGRADSVVVRDADGDMVILTDSDSDGEADYATEITDEGQVIISEHAGDGEWIVTERGHLNDDGSYERDFEYSDTEYSDTEQVEYGHSDSGTVAGCAEVRVDPRTGDWVRG